MGRKRWVLVPLLVLGATFPFFSAYQDFQNKNLQQFDQRQLLMAQHLAGGIQRIILGLTKGMYFVASDPAIRQVGPQLHARFQELYQQGAPLITAVTRMNEDGVLTYTFPEYPHLIGTSLTHQKQVQDVLRRQKTSISGMIPVVQGYLAISIHEPVFVERRFAGSIAYLLSMENLTEQILKPLEHASQFRGLVYSDQKIPVYPNASQPADVTPLDPGAYEALTERIHKESEGLGTYRVLRGEKEDTIRVAFAHVWVGDQTWPLVLESSQNEILADMVSFRNKWVLSFLMLLAFLSGAIYWFLRSAQFRTEALREVRERQVLEQREAELRQIIDASPIGIAFVDHRGRFSMVNRSWVESTGYPLAALEGFPEKMSEFFPKPETIVLLRRMWLQDAPRAKRTGEVLIFPLFPLNHPKVGIKFFEGRFNWLGDLGIIALLDVTHRQALESQQRQMASQKAHVAKMEALERMAGGVAHDLNNLLAAVVNYPDILIRKIGENHELAEPLKKISEAGRSAAAVTEDLLVMTRKTERRQEVLNLNAWLPHYVHSLSLTSVVERFPKTCFEPVLPTGDLFIFAYPPHLEKALMNLVLNAFEAIAPGEGKVWLAAESCSLNRSLRGFEEIPTGSYVRMTVKDNGPGIDPPDLPRIFDPFFSQKPLARSGTGLGLAIVWSVMKEHQGYIDVVSSELGTQFHLYFPQCPQEGPKPREDFSEEWDQVLGKRVLIVEDDDLQRSIIANYLEVENFIVYAAADAAQALAFAKSHPLDLVVFDFMLQADLDGVDVFENILALQPSVKGILISGLGQSPRFDLAKELGVVVFLKKPFFMDVLGQKIRSQLG
jgi:signal transduction histidine kinase